MSISGPAQIIRQIHKQIRMESNPSSGNFSEAQMEAHKISETTELGVEGNIALDTGVFDVLLNSISKETGTKVFDLTDDAGLIGLGES